MTREEAYAAVPEGYDKGFVVLDATGKAISAMETLADAWDYAHVINGTVLLLDGTRIGTRTYPQVRLFDLDPKECGEGVSVEVAEHLYVVSFLSPDDGALIVQIETPEHSDHHERCRVWINEGLLTGEE